MEKVVALIAYYGHEGDKLVGVFSTKERAEQERDRVGDQYNALEWVFEDYEIDAPAS